MTPEMQTAEMLGRIDERTQAIASDIAEIKVVVAGQSRDIGSLKDFRARLTGMALFIGGLGTVVGIAVALVRTFG